MFGAKIKKWIEIVNPRKKSSKNKNGNSGNLVTQQHQHQQQNSSNEYNKGAVYQSDNGNISSPSRRNEVSPIQYHNGRRGWQSPNQETPSTSKLDCPPPVIIKSSTSSCSSNHSTAALNKSGSISANNSIQQFNNNSNSNNNKTTTNYLTTAPTTFYQMKEIDQSMMMQSNNPQVIVTGSKSTSSINNNNNNNNNSFTSTSSTSTTMLHPPPLSYSTSSSNELLLDDAKQKYLISCSSSSSVNSNNIIIKNQNESNNNNSIYKQQQNGSESKYGKIQPINKYMNKYRFFSKNTSAASSTTTTTTTTIDRYNGNSSDDFCANNNNNNTIIDASTYHHSNRKNNSNNNNNEIVAINSIKRNNEINNRSVAATMQHPAGKIYRNSNNNNNNSHKYGQIFSTSSPHHHLYQQQLLTPPSMNSSISSTSSSCNTTTIVQNGQQTKLGYHVINHVSSPESAYSTGYSTDGNSPGGCSYTPDSYYINIRTGIHYFPKGNAATIDAAGNNRFKSGLNRIEEKNDETQFCHHTHKRTESFDFGKNVTVNALSSSQHETQHHRTLSSTSIKSGVQSQPCSSPGMSPVLRKNIIMATQFRTPSPRQRCRIRTNPWVSTVDPEQPTLLIPTTPTSLNNKQQRRDRDSTGSTSSGIKSDESNEMQTQKTNKKSSNGHITDSDSSSSTEKPSKTLLSLTEFRKKFNKQEKNSNQLPISISTTQHGESDEDATLNEIGKFDESYVYEKENDIISDSDRTDCVSDLGQEAGDECESTDDLLDVDYNDKNKSEQSVVVVVATADSKKKQIKVTKKTNSNNNNNSNENQQKKRKKLVRKRSKNTDNVMKSPLASRGCRSVGGTPVSIRRNEQRIAERRQLETSLSNRSNSLTFNEVHLIHSRMLAISESEKALIKADLEADVKYRQLIHEAESILISMKSNLSTAAAANAQPNCVQKEIPTAICSPRRQNVPTNKRVEMLRNCEVDLKRELAKTSNNNNKCLDAPSTVINKRLEILRYETSMSAPSSPKTNRVAPIKTHVTNFIYQNEMQTNIAPKIMPAMSPTPLTRRFLTPKQQNDVDTDSSGSDVKSNKENKIIEAKISQPIAQFRSVMCNNAESDDLFFPQSEPLKRKIYSCNSTIDKIQRSLDFDSELPKKALLQKIQMLRKERQAAKSKDRESSSEAGVSDAVSHDSPKRVIDENIKRKLIMKTIEDIKRSLEDQSLELNELHDSDT